MDDTYKYIEIVKDGITNRGTFYEYKYNYLLDYYGKPNHTDCYHSIFYHSKEIIEYSKKHSGFSGYNGEVGIDYLYWDMDSDDLSGSLADTCTLLDRLINSYGLLKHNIRVYFSGNKGFHIIYVSPEFKTLRIPNLNNTVKRVCSKLAEDIYTFDNHIYDKTRIFRTPNSINGKTGLYKIELNVDEVMHGLTIDVILERAKGQIKYDFSPDNESLNTKLLAIINETSSISDKKESKYSIEEIVDGIKNGFSSGHRNNGLTSLAGILHSRCLPSGLISAILSSANTSSEDPLPDSEVERICSSVSRYNVNPLFIDPSHSDISTMEDASKAWKAIRKNRCKISMGFPHIDKYIEYFDPGQVMLVCARAGVGKTTLAMQISNSMARHTDGFGLFTSLEMAKHSIFERTAVIEANKTYGKDINLDFVADKVLNDNDFYLKTLKAWEGMLIVDRSPLSLESIEKYFNLAQESRNFKVNNLIIDYGGLIAGTDDYEGVSKVARALKPLSKRLSTRIIIVVQLSRKAEDGYIPVTINMLRDTGAWEEAADYILGCWLSRQDPNRIHSEILKNRYGISNMRYDFIKNGLSFTTEDFKEDRMVSF